MSATAARPLYVSLSVCSLALGIGWLGATALHAEPLTSLRVVENDVTGVIARCSPAFVFIGGGSGFVVSDEGLVLTNEHVVAGRPADQADKPLEVFLSGGKRFLADVLGHDPGGDLALLKLREPPGVTPLVLGDSDAVQVGERVVALGDPFLLASEELFIPNAPPSYQASASLGIVSAVHRFSDTYCDAIQVDVAVNRGNSGGPLLNLKGEVIGINGKIETRLEIGINTGVGYAIPANQIRRFMDPLAAAEGGIVHHGTIRGLGVAERSGDAQGLAVLSVRKNSLAAKLGFRKKDRIIEIAGYPVPTRHRYQGIIGTFPSGTEVPVTVRRGGETVRFVAPLIERGRAFLGIETQASVDGLLVVKVHPGTAAARGRIAKGDVIRRFGGEDVDSSLDLVRMIRDRTPGELVKITLLRANETVDIEVRLGGLGRRT